MANKRSEIQAKYDAKNTKQYRLKLNFNTDTDIMERLAEVENMQGYIKELIRQDIGLSPLARAIRKKDAEGYVIAGYDEEEGYKALSMSKDGTSVRIAEQTNGDVSVEEDGKVIEVFRA